MALAIMSAMLIGSFTTFIPPASAATPNLTVSTQTNTGTALTGYWVEVTTTSGTVVQSGYSPVQFSLAAGSYDVIVGDYGGEYFSHWADATQTRSHAITVGSTGSTSLTAIYCPQSGCGGSSILVNSQYSPSGTLSGMYVVLASGGQTVATGFTPAVFSTNSGQSYTVTVSDYTNAYFFEWSNGATTRTTTVAATSSQTSLTALYCAKSGGCGSSGSTTSTIEITSRYANGTALQGMYTTVLQGATTVGSGFTPFNFASTNGQTYSITVSDYTNADFSQWSSGVTSDTIVVTANTTETTETAIYCPTSGCPSSGGGGGSTGDSITVTSSLLQSGAAVTGMYVDLRLDNNHIEGGYTPVTFSGLQAGAKYLVVVYWYGDYYFRHFSNGNLQRYSYVTLNATAGQNTYSMNALYEQVPTAQAASLNIIAQFPNGTQIGTASEISGYPQHTPGMYLTVTPPGGTAPFTATFTGGSILPFVFFNKEAYTVSMSTGYSNITFSYWKDNGSTSPTRSVTLNGNETLIAIYTQA
jgi:hypothetical protein